MSKRTGTCKFYNEEKGYGFIKETNGSDIFFHVTGLLNQEWIPKAGDKVSFEGAEGKRGPKAVEIQQL